MNIGTAFSFSPLLFGWEIHFLRIKRPSQAENESQFLQELLLN